jgi:endoglucanase
VAPDMPARRKVLPIGAAVAVFVIVIVAVSSTGTGRRSATPAPRRQLTAPPTVVAQLAFPPSALTQITLPAESSGGGISPCCSRGQRLPGPRLYVDPGSHAADQVRQWNAEGRARNAQAIERIAVEPTAVWLTGAPQDATDIIHTITTRAAQSGAIPVFVVYDVPHRDCGNFSAGGAPSAEAYRQWIGEISLALANKVAIVIIEPDAVAQVVTGCISNEAAQERYALLHIAVDTLAAYSNVRVYLDAGNAGWVKDPHEIVQSLRRAGVADARGFSLNVANFFTTDESYSYGVEISKELDEQHFVIDTSRNGNGPVAQNDPVHWCNPPGRALGAVPTLNVGRPLVDAYLWVKQPGDSDGSCRAGAPAAGQWWADYALDLASGTNRISGS